MWIKCSLRQGMTYVRFWKDKWSRNHSLNEMSQTVNMTLKALLSIKQSLNTIATMFCPTDEAFYSLKHPQVPFTLHQYQIAPSNHDKETLENSLTYGSKVWTLLLGHPLVVRTLPGDSNTSINGVKIVDLDTYHGGHVIVHGLRISLILHFKFWASMVWWWGFHSFYIWTIQ